MSFPIPALKLTEKTTVLTFFLSGVAFSVLEFHIVGLTQDMLMYVSFPWLSIIFLRFVHLMYMSLLLLFLAAWGIFHCLNIFSSLILLLMNNLSSLQFLTIMNKAAMSIPIKDFCYYFHFSRVNVWELKYWSLGMCQFKFEKLPDFFPQNNCWPCYSYESFNFSISSLCLGLSILAILVGVYWYFPKVKFAVPWSVMKYSIFWSADCWICINAQMFCPLIIGFFVSLVL